eukprot:c18642_g1_i2.p1 GENE.c18642_g1_i2~~c18642_g1_i2.p1  ORF type:complete len:799 (+),score=205.63 c18642_g1_i2:81-2477(+)
MGDLFRSQEMKRIEIFMQAEAARATVEELGKAGGVVQFIDLNPTVTAYNRTFVKALKRCDDLEKVVGYFEQQLSRFEVPFEPLDHSKPRLTMDAIDLITSDMHRSVTQLCANGEVLEKSLNEVRELLFLLEASNGFFDEDTPPAPGSRAAVGPADSRRLLDAEAEAGGMRGTRFVTGIMDFDPEWVNRFTRVLWRVTRGNMFVRLSRDVLTLKDPATGVESTKLAFAVFLQGERIESKVVKIAEAHNAAVFNIPATAAARRSLQNELSVRVADLSATVSHSHGLIKTALSASSASLALWAHSITYEKAVYAEMNKFKAGVTAKALIAEAWVPVWADAEIDRALVAASTSAGASVQSFFHEKPTRAVKPTFFRTNKYTKGFQTIIDAYGMADYQEANPGVFLMVTFPFLFGVMFGDVGHGAIVALFAGLLIVFEQKIQRMGYPEIFGTVFNGRYLIFVMGLFAIYCGFLYNDCFSLSIDIFGTNYLMPAGNVGNAVVKDTNRAYPFGLDPGWAGASNKLMFYNSIKMKMAILLGVLQMLFGIVLSCTNQIHFKDYTSIFCEFIPQVLFLMSMFGYMVFLIILKWVGDLNDPPLILGVIIDMFLKAGSLPAKDAMFDGQEIVQTVLLFTLFVCPPWMLIPKPLILWLKRRGTHHRLPALHGIESDEEEAVLAGAAAAHEEDHGMAEIVVHQVIHTIEFVLGTISNTASYLRLWALSLAHAELSEVIWDQLFFRMLHSGNPALIYGGFAAWAAATTGILLIMESLSAFLHALRLHWVEAAGKHYKGMGIKFIPHTNNAEPL